jgi:hypothetical protein
LERTEEVKVLFVRVAFAEKDADSWNREEVECVSMEEEYELWLVWEEEKLVLV